MSAPTVAVADVLEVTSLRRFAGTLRDAGCDTLNSLEHIMSDPIAQAAEAMNAAPASIQTGDTLSGAMTGVVQTAVSAPVAAAVIATLDTLAANAEARGNVLVNSTPTVEAPNVVPAADAGAPEAGAAPVAGGDELPRESHLMLLEHKLGIVRAKLINAERVSLDEFEGILVHIRAVL